MVYDLEDLQQILILEDYVLYSVSHSSMLQILFYFAS